MALIANSIYQGSQWMVLVILAKMLSAADVGCLAIAVAICSPITTFSALNMRSVQITDARNTHRFGHFLSVQLCTSSLAMVIIIAITAMSDQDVETKCVVVVTGVGQSILLIRDVYIALYQKVERMDLVAVSNCMLAGMSLTVLALVLWITRNLAIGIVAMQAVRFAILLFYDRNAARRLADAYDERYRLHAQWDYRDMLSLIWLALPLGITSVLLTLYNNIPRYFIAEYMGQESLGYFAAIVSLAMAGTMVTRAAGLSALPRLSKCYIQDRRRYLVLLVKLILVGMALGVAGVLVVEFFGSTILTIVFSEKYAEYVRLFKWSMIFGASAYVVTFLGYGMTAMRRFRIQPLANFGAVAVACMTAFWLVPEYGLVGGVWCLIYGKIFQGVIAAAVIMTGLRGPAVSNKELVAEL